MFRSFIVSLCLMSSAGAFADTVIKDLTVQDIDTIRLHTSLIPSESLKNVLTLKTTAMAVNGSCTKGGFIPLDGNQSTYAAILSSYIANKNMSVQYDTTQGLSPSDTSYCAILYFDIKN